MIRPLAHLAIFLAWQGPAPPPGAAEDPAAKAEADAAEVKALASYNEQRGKTPETAAAQWKLALWCEQNGLRPEAFVHFGRVIELDPRRDDAWRKLGFKKHEGRWMTDPQLADEARQKAEDKAWAPRLKAWHKEVHPAGRKADPRKAEEARAALDAVTDPAAIASIYREFGGGAAPDQAIAARLLGQIESPTASKILATLAIYGKTPEVRRLATETLRSRPAGDYLDFLVGMMQDPLRYEVRPVGGPGSPGVLVVEGERFNVRRFYSPPPPPNVAPRPGDQITYDAAGMPVITRTFTTGTSSKAGVPGSKTLAYEYDAVVKQSFSYSQAMQEAQRGAANAQAQLTGDIAQVDAINEGRRKFAEVVIAAARAASGKNLGITAKDWRDGLADAGGRYKQRPRARPTRDEEVPLDYLPNFASAMTSQSGVLRQVVVDS